MRPKALLSSLCWPLPCRISITLRPSIQSQPGRKEGSPEHLLGPFSRSVAGFWSTSEVALRPLNQGTRDSSWLGVQSSSADILGFPQNFRNCSPTQRASECGSSQKSGINLSFIYRQRNWGPDTFQSHTAMLRPAWSSCHSTGPLC